MSVFKHRVRVVLSSLAIVPLLYACGGSDSTCESSEPYIRASNNDPLRVPEGLSKPPTSPALEIPAAKSTGRTGGCLAEPPSFFRTNGLIARNPDEVVLAWAQSWAARDVDAVVALYSTTFVPPTDTADRASWLEQRREQVATGPIPDSMVDSLRVKNDGNDKRIVTFVQRFGANSLRKELTMVREANSWRISAEKVVNVD